MKLLLALFLFGVTCCLAEPDTTCRHRKPDEELKGCYKIRTNEGVNKLDAYCRSVNCSINVYDDCDDYFGDRGVHTYRRYHRFHRELCRDTPLRKKLLDNMECLKDVIKPENLGTKCGADGTDDERQAFCDDTLKNQRKSWNCVNNFVNVTCGGDARDAFEVAYFLYKESKCPH